MKKRMLCLLLALVMTLSLCVPALAADEFAAEAVTEVEEQAPVAPVEPEAPEAEEPAEEPVVDEPAAEEPVEADVPEVASVIDEIPEEMQDDPMAIAVGDIKEKWELRLEKALELAKPYKTRVDAGELFVTDDTPADADWKDFDYEKNDPAKTFNDAYAEVERNLQGISGIETGGDVTEASAQTAIITLMRLIPAATGADWGSNKTYKMDTTLAAGTKYLTDKLTSTMENAVKPTVATNGLQGYLYNKNASDYTYKSSVTGVNQPVSGTGLTLIDGGTGKTFKDITDELSKTPWTLAYRSDYIEALKTAVAAAETFSKSAGKYADFYKVAVAIQAAYELEEDAGKPTKAEAAELQAAIKETKAKLDDVHYNDFNWVYGSTVGSSDGDVKTAVSTAIQGISILAPGTTDNDFVENTTYYAFRNALKTVKIGEDLKEVKAAIKPVDVDINKHTTGNLKDEISDVEFEVNIDMAASLPYTYYYAYTVNGHWADTTATGFDDGSGWAGDWAEERSTKSIGDSTQFTVNDSVNGGKKTNKNLVLRPLREEKDKTQTDGYYFKKTDEVIVYFYVDYLGRDTQLNTTPIATWKVEFPSDGYTGPGIAKKADGSNDITVTYGNSTTLTKTAEAGTLLGNKGVTASGNTTAISITVGLSKAFAGMYSDTELDSENDVYLVLLDTNRKEIAIDKIATAERDSSKTTLTFDALDKDKEDKLTATGMTLELRVATKSGEAPVAHPGANCSVPVTFKDLTTWVNADNDLAEVKSILTDAKKIQKADVELTNASKTAKRELDTCWNLFTGAITNLQTLVDGASSKVNTINNRQAVIDQLNVLLTDAAYMQIKTPNKEELSNAIAKAEDMLVDEDDYSAASWINFEDALWAAKEAMTSATKQSAVDAATKALEDAIKALTGAPEVNKTGLNASIAAAEALKEDDYTAESWAANKTAIDTALAAAKTVAANEDATQAAVDAAKAALDAALAKLVKVKPDEPEGPKAPTANNGTGWVYYNNEWYFFKAGKLVANYWVGKIDGASQWDNNWYYVGADGKMLTGMQYLDDLHGGMGWYFLQPTNTKGEIGKMLTGWQYVDAQYGSCWFSAKSGESGKCTYSSVLGDWNGTTWVKK